MKLLSHSVVATVAFLLGCGLVAVLENDNAKLADPRAEYERMARELRQLRDENRGLADRQRRVEVGLPHAEADDVPSVGLQGLHFGCHGQRGRSRQRTNPM